RSRTHLNIQSPNSSSAPFLNAAPGPAPAACARSTTCGCGQAARLVRALDRLIEDDRYPLSPRVTELREIRALLKPYPERPLAAPPQPYLEPPSKGRYSRRR
ncbi:MAG: hypothetical protein J2P48_01505, partial [Alphaproteobacteria bacterium]|nr:hypothetical protein [Alphaproteobacteria bacterium]